jgi:hypothetical protein
LLEALAMRVFLVSQLDEKSFASLVAESVPAFK